MWGGILHRALCAVSVQQIHSSAAPFLLPALCTAGIKAELPFLDIHLPLLVADLQGERALFDCPSADLALSISLSGSASFLSRAAGLCLAWEGDTPWISTWIQTPCWAACSPRAWPQGWRDSGIHDFLCCLGACPCCLCSGQVMPILPALPSPSRFLHPAHTGKPPRWAQGG